MNINLHFIKKYVCKRSLNIIYEILNEEKYIYKKKLNIRNI
jgi:hypothetical protein